MHGGRTLGLVIVALGLTACVMYTRVEHFICFSAWPPVICKTTTPWASESRTKDDDVHGPDHP
jgi:hypothetical protein